MAASISAAIAGRGGRRERRQMRVINSHRLRTMGVLVPRYAASGILPGNRICAHPCTPTPAISVGAADAGAPHDGLGLRQPDTSHMHSSPVRYSSSDAAISTLGALAGGPEPPWGPSSGAYRQAYWTCLFHLLGRRKSHFSPHTGGLVVLWVRHPQHSTGGQHPLCTLARPVAQTVRNALHGPACPNLHRLPGLFVRPADLKALPN